MTPILPISEATTTTQSSSPARRVVAIGGGTGLSSLLRGLKRHLDRDLSEITAVVTVSDDGGSSGRLRREFGVLPPGDIRNCLVALANDEDLVARLFQYRFATGDGLTGHSFGNLFLTALTGITGDFYQAVLTAETVLSVCGRILPATLSDVVLSAEGRSGKTYSGESAVGLSGERLVRLWLDPGDPPAFRPAVEALGTADLIVLGPGSLYTSVAPNLLIPGIRHAVEASNARVVVPLNLMTQPGETDELDGGAHLDAIVSHLAPGTIDAVIINSTTLRPEQLRPYEELGSRPVDGVEESAQRHGIEVVGEDLLLEGELIRHDPKKLAAAVLGLV